MFMALFTVVVILLVLAVIRSIGTVIKNEHPTIGFLLRVLFWNTAIMGCLFAITVRRPEVLKLNDANWTWSLWWLRFLEIYLEVVACGVALAQIGFVAMVMTKECHRATGQRFRLVRSTSASSPNTETLR